MKILDFCCFVIFALLVYMGCSRKSTGPDDTGGFQVEWEKTIGGLRGYDLQSIPGGGYIVAGVTTAGAGSVDYFLAKIDEFGDTLWTKAYGGYLEDWCRCVQPTSDGGYVLAGFSDSFDPYNVDIYVVKTDDTGDTLWTRTFGGGSSDRAYSVQQTGDDGFVISGSTYSFGAGESDIFLIRMDGNGDTIWTSAFGGDGIDEGFSVIESSDGCYLVAGRTTSFGAGDQDAILLKVDSNGNEVWKRTFGREHAEDANEIQKTSDGGYVMIGGSAGYGSGYYDFYLVKVDEQGSLVWSKSYGDSVNNYGLSVQETPDGGYIMTGSRESGDLGQQWNVYLVRVSSDGGEIYSGQIGYAGNEIGYSIRSTNDGCYLIAGYTDSFAAGDEVVYLLKIAPQ